MLYSYIKKPNRGVATKIIRIEIFDADKFDHSDQICKCEVGLCAQYSVKRLDG